MLGRRVRHAVGAARRQGPPLFSTSLPKEEFAARRAKVLQKIGDGVVVMQGATETSAYEKFRQSNQFYYLTGVETPRAILVIDGRAKSTHALPQSDATSGWSARKDRCSGRAPPPKQLTGIEHVLPRAEFDKAAAGLAGRTVYTTVRGETVLMGTPDRASAHARAREADPWDQQPSREAWFKTKLAAKAPGAKFENLDDILDEMRMIKSPREIALLRESSRIAGAGDDGSDALGRARACTSTRSRRSATTSSRSTTRRGPAYFGLVAAGKNAAWPHYHAAQAQMKAGDLVLFDYAPGLPLLHVGRDAHVPGERQVHRRSARALRHLREAVPGDHDVDPSGPDARDPEGRRQEDGRGDGVAHVREPEEPRGGRRASSRATARG